MRLLLINPRFPESFWSSKWAVAGGLPNKGAPEPAAGPSYAGGAVPAAGESQDRRREHGADPVGTAGRHRRGLWHGRAVLASAGVARLLSQPRPLCGRRRQLRVALPGTIHQPCRHRGRRGMRIHLEGVLPRLRARQPQTTIQRDRQGGPHRLPDASLRCESPRVCPFVGEFCDIIVMFGRKPRVKSLEQVGRELDELRRLKVHNAFFVDDNLIGNLPVAKKLLAFLKEYQDKHNYRFSFGTEASLNMAQHKDLLQLFRDAHFGWVFIGIESTDPASLAEIGKTQNLHEDILTSALRIYSYGIDVMAGFIIGFDHDTTRTFEQQYRFITEAGIMVPMIGLLTALPKTPLYDRLKREGRLTALEDVHDNTRPDTNVIPMSMPYEAMVDGYIALYKRLLTDREIARRIRNQLRFLSAPTYGGGYSTRQGLGIFWRLVLRGIIPGGPRRIWHFLRTLPWLAPAQLPTVAADWIGALSMKEFAERRVTVDPAEQGSLERRVDSVRSAIQRYLAAGNVTLKLRRTSAPDLAVCLKGKLDGLFFKRAAPGLERLLKDTRASVTLRVDALQTHQFDHFQGLLSRLARYGDRVHIVVDERLRALVPIDSSVFNLVFARRVD